MKLDLLSFVALCLIGQAFALPQPRMPINGAPVHNNMQRDEAVEDGTQIAEGWKRDDEVEDGTQIAEGWKRDEEVEDGTQIAEGW